VDNYRQPWWSKILERLFGYLVFLVIIGGILVFALISLWPFIACALGQCTFEVGPIGENDCNPNWTGAGAC
jgi:hypothetical protein